MERREDLTVREPMRSGASNMVSAVGAACFLAIAIAVAPLPAAGSPLSERLYARGLVDFADRKWEAAWRFFDQAVRADPEDHAARYYRGLASARIGQIEQAIADLEAAVGKDERLVTGALDLGILYFARGDLDGARAWLQRAAEQPKTRFRAALFLGLTEYRAGDATAARRYLTEAARDPALREAAQYYAAVVAIRAENEEGAGRAMLRSLVETSPDSPFAELARRYLAGQPLQLERRREARRWAASLETGFEYDTNVVLAPDDEAIKDSRGIGDQADARFVVRAGALWRAFEGDGFRLHVAYDLSQSVHADLREFDLQAHRVSAALAAARGRFQFGVAGAYDFYLLDYESFLHEGIVRPWLRLSETRLTATEVAYRLRGRDFTRLPFDPFRDALGHAVDLRQHFLLGYAALIFGYQFEDESTLSSDGDDFDFSSHQAEVEVRGGLGNWGTVAAAYLARIEDYDAPNSRSPSGFRRHDFEQQAIVDWERPFAGRAFVGLRYLADRNDSNLPEFEFTRHIVAVRAGVRF